MRTGTYPNTAALVPAKKTGRRVAPTSDLPMHARHTARHRPRAPFQGDRAHGEGVGVQALLAIGFGSCATSTASPRARRRSGIGFAPEMTEPAICHCSPGSQMAPIVRVGLDGDRELVMARWGMPGPPQYGGQPVTNIRNVSSPHWRGWLGQKYRCIVPTTSFCEYEDTKPRKTPIWFALPRTGHCLPSRVCGRPGAAPGARRARRSWGGTSCSAS